MNHRQKIKENYNDPPTPSWTWRITSIFWMLITFIAVYYSFQIEGGFKLGPFLLAFFFSPIYLVWGIYKAGIPPPIKINHP